MRTLDIHVRLLLRVVGVMVLLIWFPGHILPLTMQSPSPIPTFTSYARVPLPPFPPSSYPHRPRISSTN